MSNKTQVWFTSDHHFLHRNIIEYSKRPYGRLESMHEDFIKRWNNAVAPHDTVYHLGDIAFIRPGNEGNANWILQRLNGRIFYILGNHDKNINAINRRFEWVKPYAEISIEDEDARNGRQSIVLMHYAMRVWNKSHYGAWHLYGHSHGSLADDPSALSFDVGVDCHNYTPVSYDQAKAIMATKKFKPVDHHGNRDFDRDKI